MRYDVVIIGGGPGGYKCAAEAGKQGLTVALIEKRATLGGTCLNVGCIPTKALLDCSHRYHSVKHSAHAGITTGDVSFDYSQMLSFKESVIDINVKGIQALMKQNKVTVFTGTASFITEHSLTVSGEVSETIEFHRAVIATGSDHVTLPFIDSTQSRVLNSTDALEVDPPQTLAIIGSGAIGLEFAQHFSRLGTQVTILEHEPRLAPMLDEEISKTLERTFKKEKISVATSTQVTHVGYDEKSVTLTGLNKKGKEITITADYLLSATGRKPNTQGLGIENAGVITNDRGQITVTPHFETSQKHIYAIGDVAPGMMLAHKAEYEGILVAQHIAGKTIDTKIPEIPGVIYTHPEAASIGLTEQSLKESGSLYKKGVAQFRANGRARAVNEIEGFVKILAHEDGSVAGIHIVGAVASELIAEAGVIMKAGMTVSDIAHTVHAHPTFSETLKEAAEACLIS